MATVLFTRRTARAAVRSAVVIADDPRTGRRVGALLDAAGLVTVPEHQATAGDHLLVLAFAGPAISRVDAIRAATLHRDHVALLAALPGDAGNRLLRRALRVGVDGIVFDEQLDEMLAPTACAVAAGLLAVPPSLRRQIAPQPLTHREKEIMGLVVLGYTNRQIADSLFLAESTVKTHLSSAFGKLDARSRSEAAAVLLDPEECHGFGVPSTTTDVSASAA